MVGVFIGLVSVGLQVDGSILVGLLSENNGLSENEL